MRPLDPALATNRAVLILTPLAALLGALFHWKDGAGVALEHAVWFALIAFGSWALARELDPDDNPAAFVSLATGVLVALSIESPGILIVFVTLGLVRIVNRTSGLAARKSDSIILMVLSILAFILDGSLREPLRHQWLFGLVCIGAVVVYMVDHDVGPDQLRAPDTLLEWLGLMSLLVFALNTLLTRKVHARADSNRRRLDVNRVRGGMAVGLVAGLQGSERPESVAVIIAVMHLAGISCP